VLASLLPGFLLIRAKGTAVAQKEPSSKKKKPRVGGTYETFWTGFLNYTEPLKAHLSW